MGYKIFVLTCLVFSVAYCFASEESEEGDDDLVRMKEAVFKLSEEMKQNLDEQMAELKDTIETVKLKNGAKLDNITKIVESIRRTQKFVMICTEGICGDHGTCELLGDNESYECRCEEGYAGEHCEISAPCSVEAYNAEGLPILLGSEAPRCADDGSYAGMQFMGSQAFCVTRDKVEIYGYSVDRWETGDDMNCQCARDEYEHAHFGSGEEKEFNCQANGNYPQVACDLEECWCQDWQGHPYGEHVPLGDLDTSLNC